MVKKLFKHEILYYLRSMLPIYVIVLAIAALSRTILFFETDNTLYDILSSSSITSFVVASIVCLVLTIIFTIVRYYRNLFTAEGYLSFTLPVTPAQHLWVKLLTATLVQVASTVIVLAAVCIVISGDPLNELIKAGVYLLEMPERAIRDNYWMFAIEFSLITLLSGVFSTLLFYSCITIGQMFNKNRVAAAVGVYVGYQIVTQVLGTVFVVISAFLPWEDMLAAFAAAPIPSVHLLMWLSILLTVIFAGLLFLLCHQIIRHKLNLE